MNNYTTFIGMDVHKKEVTLAVFPENAESCTEIKRIPNSLKKIRKFLERHKNGGNVKVCYEAGPCGFDLYRKITEWGYHCDVVAPSLTPVKPGDKRKTDRRDARKLVHLYKARELTSVYVPAREQETVRDLVRCRGTLQREILSSYHYILKFLRRRGIIYTDGSHWTDKHWKWLRSIKLLEVDQIVFDEYLGLLEFKIQRRDEIERKIKEIADSEPYREPVSILKAFKGFDVLQSMVLLTEIGDFTRFKSPRELMCYLGLVPSEYSSGGKEKRGSITKAGNSHCRHTLVQASWKYVSKPCIGRALKERQKGVPSWIVAHSWKAQNRLYKRFHHLSYRRSKQVAIVALARELVGFIWSCMVGYQIQRGNISV